MVSTSTETIKVSKKTKKILDELKTNIRESYNSVIERIIDEYFNHLKGGKQKV